MILSDLALLPMKMVKLLLPAIYLQGLLILTIDALSWWKQRRMGLETYDGSLPMIRSCCLLLSWGSCRRVLDMSWFWPDDVKFLWHLSYVTTTTFIEFCSNLYQAMTWRKNRHFSLFIAFLDSLGQEEYIARKKEKACLEVCIFCPQDWLFLSFFWHVWTCGMSVSKSLNH